MMSSPSMVAAVARRASTSWSRGMGWWLGEIALSVPAPVADWFGRRRAHDVVRIAGSAPVLARDFSMSDANREPGLDASAPLATMPRPGAAVTLLLPRGWLLRRPLRLPLAAASDLHAAAAFLIDRVSPFRADDVLHAVRVLRRDRRRKELCAEVAIVPRDLLEPVLATLAERGVALSRVLIEGDASGFAWDFRLPRVGRPHGRPLVERVRKTALAGTLLAVLAGPQVVAYGLDDQAGALADELAAVQARTRRAIALRADVEARTSESSFLARRRAGLQAIEVVDALSSLLPDHAWLFRLDVHPGEASLAGLSSDVPGVLKSLALPPFASPELMGPVVSGLAEGKSRFELRVRFGPRAPG